MRASRALASDSLADESHGEKHLLLGVGFTCFTEVRVWAPSKSLSGQWTTVWASAAHLGDRVWAAAGARVKVNGDHLHCVKCGRGRAEVAARALGVQAGRGVLQEERTPWPRWPRR